MTWSGKIQQGEPGDLRERAERFQSIFENSTLGIFQSSLDGRFLMVNPAFAKILGYDDPEDLRKSVQDIESQFYHQPERRSEILAAIDGKAGVSRFETELYRKDGSLITCSLSIQAIMGSDGKISHLDGFIEDVTEGQAKGKEAPGTLRYPDPGEPAPSHPVQRSLPFRQDHWKEPADAGSI